MHDYNIGKHCQVPECKQKDWLPVKCKYCNHMYCADHSTIQSHHCKNYEKQFKKVYTCPLCNKIIQMNNNLSVNENFQIHQAMECKKDYQQNVKKYQMCPGKRCGAKLTQLNKYICKFCHKDLCLKHRLKQDHDCKIFF